MSAEYTIDFWDLADFKLEKRVNEDGYSFLCKKGENNENNLDCREIKITVKKEVKKEVKKDITIYLFPIIKVKWLFKWIQELKKTDYLFLFLWELDKDKNSILIFSNDIAKYFSEYCKKNAEYVKWNNLVRKDKQKNISEDQKEEIEESSLQKVLEQLTSSFYLFQKEAGKEAVYKWKNILSFFDVLIAQALGEKTSSKENIESSKENIESLIYAIKGDSISFFKARYMQEKTIKTLIEWSEGEAFLSAMFFWNLIKNLTLKIKWNLIDLNGRGLWGFNLKTSKNNYQYFTKIKDLLEGFRKGTSKLQIPIFFIDKDNNKTVSSFSFDNVIDIFPKAFKEDSDWNTYVLDFKEKNRENSEEIQELFKSFRSTTDNTDKINKILAKMKERYRYILLDDRWESWNKEKTKKEKKEKKETKELTKSDLFILLNKEAKEEAKEEANVFLWKIKEKTKKGEEYIEMYKLHQNLGKYKMWKYIEVNKVKNGESNNITFKVPERDPLSLPMENQSLNFELSDTHDNKLTYFFNWASLEDEDWISIWLIYLLNGGIIYTWDKKANKWELADIIWYNYDRELKKSIIHLLHIKTAPFLKDGRDGSYSYYSTAIGQMLQKVEPILNFKEEEINKFFNTDTEIEEKISEKIKQNEESKVEIKKFDTSDMINNLKESDSIDLLVWVPILWSQLKSFINNGTFYMIENILIKGFENTIKPFLKKQVTLSFCPIVIQSCEEKSWKQ